MKYDDENQQRWAEADKPIFIFCLLSRCVLVLSKNPRKKPSFIFKKIPPPKKKRHGYKQAHLYLLFDDSVGHSICMKNPKQRYHFCINNPPTKLKKINKGVNKPIFIFCLLSRCPLFFVRNIHTMNTCKQYLFQQKKEKKWLISPRNI